MLATLTSSLPAPPPAPAIDSVISADEDAVPEAEEISNFELTEPKDKEYDAGELADAASIGQLRHRTASAVVLVDSRLSE